MTARYLAFHAAERPNAVALVVQGREITFAQFHTDLGKVTRALKSWGLAPGQAVAIRCADLYWHWLLQLGFESLDITTASLDEREGEDAAGFLTTVDLLLTDVDRFPSARDFRLVTPEWCREVLAGEAVGDEASGGGTAPVRIIRTSGTTGLPKRLHYSRRMRDAWLAVTNWYVPQDTTSRFLMALPCTVEAVNAALTCCLRAGGTAVSVPANQTSAIPDLIARHGITHIGLLPAQLQQLLAELPADFRKPAGLTIVTFGGAVSNALRAEALARLTERLYDLYGTNEAGLITLRRTDGPEGVGLIAPMSEAEVVDEAGVPVPAGEAGWLRLRGAGTFEGYLDDPETNRRMFRDGWFYPGDVGILLGNRRLHILGRGDELINVGGVKIGPDRIEDQVRTLAGAQDVGACGFRNRAGVQEVYLGVARQAGEDDGLYDRVLQAVDQLGVGKFYVVKLDRVPRNANGKIRRKQLKRAIADEILRHDPDWTSRVLIDPAEIDPVAEER